MMNGSVIHRVTFSPFSAFIIHYFTILSYWFCPTNSVDVHNYEFICQLARTAWYLIILKLLYRDGRRHFHWLLRTVGCKKSCGLYVVLFVCLRLKPPSQVRKVKLAIVQYKVHTCEVTIWLISTCILTSFQGK